MHSQTFTLADPVRMLVVISGDENAVVTGDLGSPLRVRCLAYGYPPPSVFWYRGYEGVMVPYNDAVYETRGNVLLIKKLAIETLGKYTCQAYNGEGKAATWVVFVRAYQPEGSFIENEFLVPRNELTSSPKVLPPITVKGTTTTSTTTTTEAPRPLFTGKNRNCQLYECNLLVDCLSYASNFFTSHNSPILTSFAT